MPLSPVRLTGFAGRWVRDSGMPQEKGAGTGGPGDGTGPHEKPTNPHEPAGRRDHLAVRRRLLRGERAGDVERATRRPDRHVAQELGRATDR